MRVKGHCEPRGEQWPRFRRRRRTLRIPLPIDEPCQIGRETTIWHFSHVMTNCSIGETLQSWTECCRFTNFTLGNNVKVQNNVSIYTGVELENDVFCGPSMVFTNVINPRSHISRKNEYRRTLVKRGATLGANCTIVCGVTVGEYAFIAAGAVVNRDVRAYALMMGVPARQVGWMCYCGVRLHDGSDPVCEACGRHYLIKTGLVARSRGAAPTLASAAAYTD